MNDRHLRDRTSREIVLDTGPITIHIRESLRAQTMRLVVGPRRPIHLVVPQRVADHEIDRFLDAKRRWVEERVAASRELAERPARLHLDQPGVVWLAGASIPLVWTPDDGPGTARFMHGRLLARGRASAVAAAIDRWYRREARRRLTAVAEHEAARLGLYYTSIGIRDQRTRWGSCSAKGHLSFSWRLVVAPVEILECIVVHELCHLLHPNHSKSFWRLLDVVRPSWSEQVRWLSAHGQELRDYRPSAVPTTAD